VKGLIISKVINMRDKEKGDNFTVIKEVQGLLPLTIDDVRLMNHKNVQN
jgi:hypothetical protein